MLERSALAAALGVALLCGGCRTSLEDVRKKHGPTLEATLTQLSKVGKLLDLTPPIASDDERVSLPTAAPRPAGGAFGVPGMARHVALMYQEALTDLTTHGATANRIPGSNLLTVCASLLRNGKCPSGCALLECSCSFDLLEPLLERCAAIQFVLVVRTLEYGAPASLQRTTPDLAVARARDGGVRDGRGQGDGGRRDAGRSDVRVESWAFRGGLLRAEVHVFELSSGRRLGGFRVTAASDARLRQTTTLGRPLPAHVARSAVENDFAGRSQKALLDEIRRRVPAAFGP